MNGHTESTQHRVVVFYEPPEGDTELPKAIRITDPVAAENLCSFVRLGLDTSLIHPVEEGDIGFDGKDNPSEEVVPGVFEWPMHSDYRPWDSIEDVGIETVVEEAWSRIGFSAHSAGYWLREKLGAFMEAHMDREAYEQARTILGCLADFEAPKENLLMQVCLAIIPRFPRELSDPEGFMESLFRKALADAGLKSIEDVDEFVDDVLGNSIQDVKETLPELPDDWYTQASSVVLRRASRARLDAKLNAGTG